MRGRARATMAPMPRLLLLDTASLYFRAFYGVPDQRKDPEQPPTNAVRGLLDMIATLIQAHRPTHLVACWDDDWRPQWRVDLIASYKTHRLADGSDVAEETPPDLLPQVPVIADLLQAVGLHRWGAPGYEADDIIGSVVARHAGELPIDIVTGDRDLFQLVDDGRAVRVLYTARSGVREAEPITESSLRERYGVADGPRYLDLAVLRGDPSDGLPGISGIGEKTAAALLAAYGSLDGIVAAIGNGDPGITGARRARLEAGLPLLDAARRVVAVAADAPLPATEPVLPTAVADPRRLSELAATYGVGSGIGRVLDALGIGTS